MPRPRAGADGRSSSRRSGPSFRQTLLEGKADAEVLLEPAAHLAADLVDARDQALLLFKLLEIDRKLLPAAPWRPTRIARSAIVSGANSEFLVTKTEGMGTGESFRRLPVGDRGCATVSGTWRNPAAMSWCGSAPAPSVSSCRAVVGSTCGRRFPCRATRERVGTLRRRTGLRDRDRPGEASPEGGQVGRAPKPLFAGVREMRDRLHHVHRIRVGPRDDPRPVLAQVAGGAGVQALQIRRAAWPSPRTRGREMSTWGPVESWDAISSNAASPSPNFSRKPP